MLPTGDVDIFPQQPAAVRMAHAVSLLRYTGVWSLLAVVVLALGGCGGLNRNMQSTFLSGHDLVVMTDRMAAAIASDSHIAALTARGPMIIVLTPLKNMTNEIIPRSQGDIFLHRVRVLLTAEPSLRRRFIFVLNPQTYNHLLAQQGLTRSDLGGQAALLAPGYALQATFYSDTKANGYSRSDYYLCTYRLTNIVTGELVWEGTYEVKKAVTASFLE